jgi:hypothetical protein
MASADLLPGGSARRGQHHLSAVERDRPVNADVPSCSRQKVWSPPFIERGPRRGMRLGGPGLQEEAPEETLSELLASLT